MRTVFFIPPLTKISGGLASISELASLLAASGRECAAVSPVPDCPGMQLLDPAVKRLEWDTSGQGAFLRKGDLWCIPDGWLNALVPGVKAGAGVLMYVQNWAFMISTRPEGAAWSQLPLAYLPVSGPVDWFLREILGLHPLGILPPAIKA